MKISKSIAVALSVIVGTFSLRFGYSRPILRSSIFMSGGSESKIKLIYFDAKGAAEITRVLLKIGGLDFEDHRYSIKMVDGKFETPEFAAAKESGSLAANMNRAPVLEVDGFCIGQSKAMERYVARKCGLFGSTDEESALIDCIGEHVRDIKEKWGKIRMMGGMGAPPTPEKEVALKKWFDVELAEWFAKLEKSLPTNGAKDHTVGSSLSYADVCIWNLVKETFDASQMDFVSKALDGCERLSAIAESVANNKNLKEWLANRPVTMF